MFTVLTVTSELFETTSVLMLAHDLLRFLSSVIGVGYNWTYVTVFEADGQAELIVSIIVPPQADPIEASFYLLVNTQDGTATGLHPLLHNHVDTGLILTPADTVVLTMHTHTHTHTPFICSSW